LRATVHGSYEKISMLAGRAARSRSRASTAASSIPFGAVMNKGLTIRTGQTHVNRYSADLLNRIAEGEIDPSFVITHRVKLEDGPQMFKPSIWRCMIAIASFSSACAFRRPFR